MLDIVGCCTVETLADRWLGCHIFLGRRGRAKHNAQEKGQWSEHGIQEASTVSSAAAPLLLARFSRTPQFQGTQGAAAPRSTISAPSNKIEFLAS